MDIHLDVTHTFSSSHESSEEEQSKYELSYQMQVGIEFENETIN